MAVGSAAADQRACKWVAHLCRQVAYLGRQVALQQAAGVAVGSAAGDD